MSKVAQIESQLVELSKVINDRSNGQDKRRLKEKQRNLQIALKLERYAELRKGWQE